MPNPPANLPIYAPAGSVPEHVVAFSSQGVAAVVDAAHPLPVRQTLVSASQPSLGGTLSASGTVGPFVPDLGRPIMLTLSGTWTGTTQLLRSVDGGVTRLPLTVAGAAWASYTANCNEAVTEETEAGATYYLSVSLTAGTVTYRVAQ